VLNYDYAGFTGHVDLNYKDLVAPYIGIDLERAGGGYDSFGHAGLRGGSYAGLGLSTVTAGFVILVFIGLAFGMS